jgi:hypothetical protein
LSAGARDHGLGSDLTDPTVDADAFNAFEAAGWELRTISFSYAEPSPEALWRGLLGETVRISALILGQPSTIQKEIRAAFDQIAQQYDRGERLELPVSVKLASAQRPAGST